MDAVRVIEAVRPTHLFHGAWMATPGVYLSSPENLDWMQAGVAFVRAFAEQGGQRFVGVGSSAEYAASDVPCEEDCTPLQPSSSIWRVQSRIVVRRASSGATSQDASCMGTPFPALRTRRCTGSVNSNCRFAPARDKPLSLSHGEQKRDFIYAPDAAKMFVQLLNSDANGAFNIGTGEARSVRSVIEAVADRFSARDCLRFGVIPLREGEPPVLVASMKKFQKLLGVGSVTPFGETLDAFIASQPQSTR